MAKAVGLIGNFSGKVGNVVGYNLKDSNNKQTQGVRAYQPVVSNPKTYAQATQRVILAVVNAAYRALRDVITRGQEGVAYGNKSRLAWLSRAMKNFTGAWFNKGEQVTTLGEMELTRGSLPTLAHKNSAGESFAIPYAGAADEKIETLAQLSAALKKAYPQLKDGDQVTIVGVYGTNAKEVSVLIGTTDTASVAGISVSTTAIAFNGAFFGFGSDNDAQFAAIIHSREGSNGEHLRSTQSLVPCNDVLSDDEFLPAAKEAAIRSYMSSGSNTDWPVEQL